MVKQYKDFTNSARSARCPPRAPIGQYRIGMTDMTLDSLWDPETDKYKVLCRMVHVTKATLHISYVQLIMSFVLLMFFTYYYMLAVTGNLPAQHWVNQYTTLYISISQLIFALSLQLILVVAVVHGVRTERRSLLLPYIVYTAVAILAGCAQLANDFVNLEHLNKYQVTGITNTNRVYVSSQLVRQLIGTMIHAWCLSVVWRCYGYLGDKKIASRIGEQLSATQAAFHYPADAQLLGYWPNINSMPPPYADTVISSSAIPIVPQQLKPVIVDIALSNEAPTSTNNEQAVVKEGDNIV